MAAEAVTAAHVTGVLAFYAVPGAAVAVAFSGMLGAVLKVKEKAVRDRARAAGTAEGDDERTAA